MNHRDEAVAATQKPSGDGNNELEKEQKKKGIRYAEKRRTSSCAFADRVARLSIDHYRQIVPLEQQLPQTCLSAIVSHNSEDGSLHVLSMGVGTKFLSESTLKEEHTSMPYGRRIRDCHAEVLARRAFCRYVALEMLDLLSCGEGASNDGRILERSTSCQGRKFGLRPSISLHLYSSSAPCGNAVLKKFSKMKKEKYRENLGLNEWPTDPHEPIHGHSIKMGQFLLLVKKDTNNSINVSGPETSRTSTTEAATASPTNNINDAIKRTKTLKVWPANQSDDWAPPGTTTVFMKKGSIHTCSDKICRWNYLGLQGSLLATLVENPMYISTLTVGRKFTECICRRAVCCRLVDDNACNEITNINDDDNGDDANSTSRYRINHPAILGTGVYMDEFGAVETDPDSVGQDVRFHSSLSWAWWKTTGNTVESFTKNKKQLECIDGSTGYLSSTLDGREEEPMKASPSLLCTWSLVRLFLKIHSIIDEDADAAKEYTTLSSLCELKKEVSPLHEETKDTLFKKHRVLRQWNRRRSNGIDDR